MEIAPNQSGNGAYRVVSVLDINLVMGRDVRIFKWPKCKTRAIRDMETERFDATITPTTGDQLLDHS